jgi:hypothetical protein
MEIFVNARVNGVVSRFFVSSLCRVDGRFSLGRQSEMRHP